MVCVWGSGEPFWPFVIALVVVIARTYMSLQVLPRNRTGIPHTSPCAGGQRDEVSSWRMPGPYSSSHHHMWLKKLQRHIMRAQAGPCGLRVNKGGLARDCAYVSVP